MSGREPLLTIQCSSHNSLERSRDLGLRRNNLFSVNWPYLLVGVLFLSLCANGYKTGGNCHQVSRDDKNSNHQLLEEYRHGLIYRRKAAKDHAPPKILVLFAYHLSTFFYNSPFLLTFPVIIGNKEHQRGCEAAPTKIKPVACSMLQVVGEKRGRGERKKKGRVSLVFFPRSPSIFRSSPTTESQEQATSTLSLNREKCWIILGTNSSIILLLSTVKFKPFHCRLN